jgi:two-component system OmpR family sensor kinase
MTLRLRSVVAAAVGIVVALVLGGALVSVLVSRHLHRSLDHTLRQRAVQIAQLNASAPALLTTPGALDSPVGGTQLLVEVVDRKGAIVARSLSLGGRVLRTGPLVSAAIGDGAATYTNDALGTEQLRVYVAPLANIGGPARGGAVVVAASTHDLDETLASLHLFVVLTGLAAALLGAGAVALLMGRALEPLRRLARGAAEIERTGDPHRRLPLPQTRDEVAQLADTLNDMLASLERSREREGRFLADASHELRTPLTALRGNVEYVARRGATPEVIAELERDADRLARLADDLLVLSREESGEEPAEEIVDVAALATKLAGSEPDVEAVVEPGVRVRGERAALERAVGNLLQNARKYGPEEGRITVTVAGRDGQALLTVSDEGKGLQPYEAEQAFRRFWRGRNSRSGSGLGLPIVRAIAERHGGRAYAEGSSFTIELPRLSEISQSPSVERRP